MKPGVVVDTFQQIWQMPEAQLRGIIASLEAKRDAETDKWQRIVMNMTLGTFLEELAARERANEQRC